MRKSATVLPKTPSELGRPAILPENREQQLVSLAMDLVEQRLRDGTASSQETTHFLKLASTKAKLELANLEAQTRLNEAKIEAIHRDEQKDEMFKAAIEAMRTYRYQRDEEEDDDYEVYDD